MTETTQPSTPTSVKRDPAIPNGIVGMIFFITAEVMLFAALISSYMILRAGVPVWPPWGQPPLPIGITAFNTGILILSGALLLMSKKSFLEGEPAEKVKKQFMTSMLMGLFFVAIQGYEWIELIQKGLTLTSSTYGGLFFLIIGMHGIHALSAILGMFYVFTRLGEDDKKGVRTRFTAIQLFWFFVVGLWPIIFVVLYIW